MAGVGGSGGEGKESPEVEQIMLAEARAEVVTADHKASMVLAALGIGFSAVFAGLIAGDWDPSYLRGVGEIFWWLGAALAVVAVVLAACAVWPRFVKNDVAAGIYYWGHVATFSDLETFASAIADGSPAPAKRTRHQLWRLSHIVDKKYGYVRAAFVSAGAAVALMLLASLVGG